MGSFLHWNCRGIKTNRNELKDLIFKYQPDVFCIQETHLKNKDNFNLSTYSVIRMDNPDQSHHSKGGVAVFIKNSIHFNILNLNSCFQVAAVKVYLNKLITVCSIYLPPGVIFNSNNFEDLINQLPRPFILLGDFNAHNPVGFYEN